VTVREKRKERVFEEVGFRGGIFLNEMIRGKNLC
jgi:hypothetical protein